MTPKKIISETRILQSVLFNGTSCRILAHLVYTNGEQEYSITQVNLFHGGAEYHRFFTTLNEAEGAF